MGEGGAIEWTDVVCIGVGGDGDGTRLGWETPSRGAEGGIEGGDAFTWASARGRGWQWIDAGEGEGRGGGRL